MVDADVVREWYEKHNATPYDVSVRFDVTIEEAYRLLKSGLTNAGHTR